jgi:hypothetical protein
MAGLQKSVIFIAESRVILRGCELLEVIFPRLTFVVSFLGAKDNGGSLDVGLSLPFD